MSGGPAMIFDLLRDTPAKDETTDVCIVGAGAAGIALAVECVRRGKSVALLEAGGREHEDAAHDSYRGMLGGLAYRGMQQGRAKRLGGTTTLWGGQILELDAQDFEQRPWVEGSGWPIQKRELERFYARALELEGLASVLRDDAEVWRSLKSDATAFDELELYFSRWCPEPNFARLHRSILAGKQVAVWLHATAVRAVLEGEHVRSIEARTACGRRAMFRAKQYVFCLGSIETARFFLQPADGAPWAKSGLVGCFFQDHIDSNAATLVVRDAHALHTAFDTAFVRGYKYSPKLKLGVEAQRRHGLLNVGATVFSTDSNDATLAEVKSLAKDAMHGRLRAIRPSHVRAALSAAPHLARQTYRYAVQHRAYHSPMAHMQLRVHCEQRPLGSSAIRLTGERDAFGLLRACVHWNVAEQELQSIRGFVDIAREALAPLAEIVPHPDLYRENGSFVEQCEDSFHHMGGMRMDPSPARGVVDTDLKVHGTSNCYVCSAAVYPCSGFSNPTHTLVALAARLAERLG